MNHCCRFVGIALLAWGCGAQFAAAQAAPAAWTVMMYLAADNDLEAPQMQDLREMLKVGSTAQVNVVVLADRHPQGDGKYTNSSVANLPDWTSAKLLYVEPGRLRELADKGEANMGNPATLSDFVESAMRDYPAQRFALVFGDHGMAWPGVAVDESNDSDTLTLLEIASVLQDVVEKHGKLELIGFDACVMANLEVAAALTPFAKYLLASEEIEPVEGWDYTAWLTAVNRAPGSDGVALGRMIIDSYRDSFGNDDQAKGITLSLLDLAKIPAVESAVQTLSAATSAHLARGGRAAWVTLARARSDTEEYGRSTGARGGSLVYDLQQFAQNVAAMVRDDASRRAAGAVQAAVRNAVVYEIRGQARPNASGISIFFPPNREKLAARGETAYNETGFAQSNRWFPFLQEYSGIEAQDKADPQLGAVKTDTAELASGRSARITARLSADDIDSASFIVAIPQGDARVMIGSLPVEVSDTGELTEDWDGEWFSISDGASEFICPITEFEELDDEEDVYWAGVPAQVRLKGTAAWLDVTLNFLLDFTGDDVSGDLVYAVEETAHGPREINLGSGDQLRPVYLMIDANGEETPLAEDDEDKILHLDRLDDIKVDAMRLPAGRYQVGFMIEDLAGNTNEQMTEIEIP